jgi:hypothetical protein
MLLHGRGAAAMRPSAMPRTAPCAAPVARVLPAAARAVSAGASSGSSTSGSSSGPTTTTSTSPTLLLRSSSSARAATAPSLRRNNVAARAGGFLGGLFKQDPSENTRKKYQERVDRVNALEPAMAALDDAGLRAKTAELRQRASAGGESLDSLLPEAFAVGP